MIPPWLDPWILTAVDQWYRVIPRAHPSSSALTQARIISHRGERDDKTIIENSFASFDPLLDRVFGLECDIRFTRDGVAMVFHDEDLLRIFGARERLLNLDFPELRQRYPLIPTLAELVTRYGKKLHLSIEVKAEHRPQAEAQLRHIQAALAPLQAGQDYHLMSLDTATLRWLKPAFPTALVAIARSNVEEMSRFALQHDCAGLTGHYALLHQQRNTPHLEREQWIGIGFPSSRQALRYALHHALAGSTPIRR